MPYVVPACGRTALEFRGMCGAVLAFGAMPGGRICSVLRYGTAMCHGVVPVWGYHRRHYGHARAGRPAYRSPALSSYANQ
eukprot:3696045-Rhodomonas_salina.2